MILSLINNPLEIPKYEMMSIPDLIAYLLYQSDKAQRDHQIQKYLQRKNKRKRQ